MRANSLFYYSLLATLLPTVATAGIRVGNAARNNAQGYQQVNDLRYGAAMNNVMAAAAVDPIPADMPIPVVSAEITNSINSGDANASANMAKLEKCSMIYPEGEFAWTRPTLGRGTGGGATCTSVIEMRVIGAGQNGADAVVARANLAAGDAVECNISHFPEATYLPAAGQVEFPADAEPTIDDVVKMLNAEQRQNAGIKIAAGTVLGGLLGNISGQAEPGKDSLLGGGKAKTQGTIVGALGGAALMAGNAYSGKVAGDMILSTGVNAAAGAVVGNIVATGDSVLRIEPCVVDGRDTTCLWGYIEKSSSLKTGDTPYISAKNPSDFKVCSTNEGVTICKYEELDIANATIKGYDTTNAAGKTFLTQTNRSTGGKMDLVTLFAESNGFQEATNKFCYKDGNMEPGASSDCDDVWVELNGTVNIVTSRTPAMVIDVVDKTMGWKKSDWSNFKTRFAGSEVVGRTGRGVASNLGVDNTKTYLKDANFKPIYQDSEDGGIIDLGNKARMKGTLTGAGVGGGMGAFAGYQGAQKDIEDRWVTAVREYKDSLQKVYCATGNRFLSHYNDMIMIPNMTE